MVVQPVKVDPINFEATSRIAVRAASPSPHLHGEEVESVAMNQWDLL